MSKQTLLALDVGERRIGVAVADSSIKIAVAYDTVDVDGNELGKLAHIFALEEPSVVVVGYPRNQQGEPTQQTAFVEEFVSRLTNLGAKLVYQDESLTSVKAEEYLARQKKPYQKGDVDALAASFILQDYLEAM